MNALKKVTMWYMKIMKILLAILKTFIKIAMLLSFVLLTVFLLASFFLPIVPKIYFLIHDYDFSCSRGNVVKCESGRTCINNIKWDEDNLIVSGTFGWTGGHRTPNTVLGFYKVKDNTINLYVDVFDNQLGMLELVKYAEALAYDDKVNFKFTMKNLPKKNYKIILDNFEQWNFSIDGEKEMLLK